MQTANLEIPLTTDDMAIINDSFVKANYLDTEEETMRDLLSKKLVCIKQKMIKKLKGETPPPHIKQELCDLRKKLKTFIASKQLNYQTSCGSSCEFTCPICLEMFLTPCPTSCGHMFCYRCIDESVIRRSSCPSCRSNIRNEQFVESKPFSKMSDFFWSTSKEKQPYNQKRYKNEEWIKGRKINVENVKIEDLIDARDTEFIWCKAKIINIFNTNGKIEFLVHFLGWNQIYDEIITSNSQRLAPFKFFSERDDIPKYRVNPNEDNMRSRIDYPDSGDNQSESNNAVINNREMFSRINHFQLLNPNRPLIQQLMTRRRNFGPDFSLFNGVQNYFINLRPHRDSSSSSDSGQGNERQQNQELDEEDRYDGNREREFDQEQLRDADLDDQQNDVIGQNENFEIQRSNNSLSDSINMQVSNYYDLDEESESNQPRVWNFLNNRSEEGDQDIRREQRQSSELQVIEVEDQQNNFRSLEVNQRGTSILNQQRQIHNRPQLEQSSSSSSSSYSFECAPKEQ